MFELQTLDMVLPFAVLLLPLCGFVVLALFGDWIKRDEEDAGAGYLACATVIASFALAAWTTARLYGLVGGPTGLRFSQPYLGFEWIEVGGFRVPLSLLVDPLSSVMMLVVTGIGSLIHVYSLGYMAHDEEPLALLLVPEPLHLLHAAAGDGRQPAPDVRGLGGRGPLLLPAHRLLVQEEQRVRGRAQGVRRQPHRRRGPHPGHGLHLPRLRQPRPRGHRRQRGSPGAGGAVAVGPGDDRLPPALRRGDAARARRSRSTSGCPTPWRARPRSRPSSTRPPW